MKGLNLVNLINRDFMHNHGNNNGTNGHDSKMMWLMMLGCMLPVLILTLGGSGLFQEYRWVVLAGVGAMIAVHLWQMFKSNNHHGVESGDMVDDNKVVEPKTKPRQHGGGCCH